jgi:CRISPR-associated endoribonuclease Cas6
MQSCKQNIQICSKESELIASPQEIIAKTEKALQGTRTLLNFNTPCSFKSGGEYMLFPSVPLILNSLASKWNSIFQEYVIDDDDAMRFLNLGLKIESYNLQSSYYHLKGTTIPGFIGSIVLHAVLPIPLLEISRLLLYFSRYSGIGIKTSLGMGGSSAQGKQRKNGANRKRT